MNTPLENEIRNRFGVLPNSFRLTAADPTLTKNFWGFTQLAYLDNPLPSLFKERLFVYLSRFCEMPYCIARHVGFLVGLGYPAGDSTCPPHTVQSILPLLGRPLPHGEELLLAIKICAEFESPLSSFPEPDSSGEQAIFACATHVFLQTSEGPAAHQSLKRALGPANLEQLNLLLSFVRAAHNWTRLHPELECEDDIKHLLADHESLAECILKGSAALKDGSGPQIVVHDLSKHRQQHKAGSRPLPRLIRTYSNNHLRDGEIILRELVSIMPGAIYACDTNGIVTFFNHASDLWGRTPDVNDPPWAFLDSRRVYDPAETAAQPQETPARLVLSTGVPMLNRELVLELPDSSRINVLANIKPLRNSLGEITGAVSIFQDIGELKNAQQNRESSLQESLHELERSNRELQQFCSAVSHDLQAPARGVRTLTRLLAQRDGSSPEASSHLLTLIEQAAAGMEHIVQSLLGYAQAGHGSLERRNVPVQEIIDSAKAALAPVIAETGAQIICKPLPAVEADPALLEQLFRNLIGNALQYRRSGETPRVEISGERCGEVWQFSVKDNGEGIPLKHLDYVFEPLKRLHGNDSPGSGLGLALCRTIVTRHGGRIWVESEGSQHGATFLFTLSAAQTPPGVIQSRVRLDLDGSKAREPR